MNPTKIETAHIVKQLTRFIPNPTQPIPQIQGSWAGLKLGQRLLNLKPMHFQSTGVLNPNSLWTVVKTTNKWVDLRLEENGAIVRWTDKEWRLRFKPARTRTPHKKKDATVV